MWRGGYCLPISFEVNNNNKNPTTQGLSGPFRSLECEHERGSAGEAGDTLPLASPARTLALCNAFGRVPAPIGVLHCCSASVPAQLFSGGLLSGDGPPGVTIVQSPGTPSTPILGFSQTLSAPGTASRPGLPDGAARTHCCTEPP